MEDLVKRYFWVVHIIVIMVGATLLARTVVHVIDAKVFLADENAPHRALRRPPPRRPLAHTAPTLASKDAEVVGKRNIFCSTCAPEPVVAATEAPSDGSIPLTSLPLALVATSIAKPEALSSATIMNTQSNKQGAYWVKDQIPAAGEIVHIAPMYVAFRNSSSNRVERIDLVGNTPAAVPRPATAMARPPTPGDELADAMDKGIRKIDDTHYEIDRSLVDQVLANPAMVARGARIVPSIHDGKSDGFKMYAIRPTSVYHKIGIQNGDTLHSVNGFDISSPDKALEVYTKVKSASNLSISITRRGKPVTMEYSIR